MEKQKLRHNFGISDHVFFNYVKRAQKIPGSTGENLLKLLEMRFDTIVYRLKLAPTINSARQLISHGHFLINKKKVNIPSYQCKTNDEISVRLKSKNLIIALRGENSTAEKGGSGGNSYQSKTIAWKDKKVPTHLRLDEQSFGGTILQNISLQDSILEEYYQELKLKPLYIIEFFSRKL